MATVTVGLPVFNGEEFLERALDSLARQTFPDIQILVSDNASTDATPRILETWAKRDARIVFVRQPENVGPVANFDWILQHAKTKWFMNVAHDDDWSPRYIEDLHKSAVAKPGILLAAPQMVTFYEAGKEDTRQRYAEQIDDLPPVARIRLALRTAHAGWYYGLHDRATLISALHGAKRFNHTWGFDFIAICHVIMSSALTGTNEAIYYKRLTPVSETRYRPKTALEQYVLYRDFLRETCRALYASSLTQEEKVSLLPALIGYARHGGKPRRILKTALKELLKRDSP